LAFRGSGSESQTARTGTGHMAEYVATCPRCRASKTTFDVLSAVHVGTQYSWQRRYEAFCRCRHSSRTTTFVIAQKHIEDDGYLRDHSPEQFPSNINDHFEHLGHISLKDAGASSPPDHVPPDLAKVLEEATKCVAFECWNAAGAMFRLCVDMAKEPLVPEENVGGCSNGIDL
jgi:hypothetical protein